MPRIRTLKPDHRQHRKVGPLSDRTYRLWVGMILEADDEGRLVADAAQLRALIWSYHPRVRATDVQASLLELSRVGLIRLYQVDGVPYAVFPSWRDHQVISRPMPSKLPEYKDSLSIHGVLHESSLITPEGREGKGREGKGRERNAERVRAGALTDDSERDALSTSTEAKTQNALTAVDEVCASRLPAAIAAVGSAASDGSATANGIRPQVFQISRSILDALERSPRLAQVAELRDPVWWRSEFRAFPGVDFPAEIYKADAWMSSNPTREPLKSYRKFMHAWFARAERS